MAIQFQLVKIDSPQFAVINDSEFTNPLQLNCEVNFAVDSNLSAIKNTIKVVYQNASDPVLQIMVECVFAISPESWDEMRQSDGTVVVPVGFLQHMGTITVGTTRGILHEKTVGSNINKYVMPLVNVSELIKDDMVLHQQSEGLTI